MTKAALPIVLGLAAILSPLRADDITLSDGTVLKNAKIVQQDDANKTVTISFSGGTALVHSAMMPATPATAPQPAVTNEVSQTAPATQPPTPASPSTPMPTDWTVGGRDYRNVTVTEVDADRVHITYDGGIGTLMLADLMPELRKRFNYDPDAAKHATADRENQQAKADAELNAEIVAQQKTLAQAAAADKAKKNAAKAQADAHKAQADAQRAAAQKQEIEHYYDNPNSNGNGNQL